MKLILTQTILNVVRVDWSLNGARSHEFYLGIFLVIALIV